MPLFRRIALSSVLSIISVILIVLFIDEVLAMRTTPENISVSVLIFTSAGLIIWKTGIKIKSRGLKPGFLPENNNSDEKRETPGQHNGEHIILDETSSIYDTTESKQGNIEAISCDLFISGQLKEANDRKNGDKAQIKPELSALFFLERDNDEELYF